MKTTLFIAVLFIFEFVHAQTPNWRWAKSAGGLGHDYGESISTDGNGNCYVTGQFQFSPSSFGTTTLSGSSNYNFFIAKYDSTGTVLWAKTGISSVSTIGTGIKTDAAGNSYVVGYYQNGGSLVLGSFTLTGLVSGPTGFVAKYDPAGNVVWAANTGRVDGSQLVNSCIGIDASGNSYISSASSMVTPADSTIVIKFSAAGSLLWKKYAKGSGNSPFNNWKATDIDTDANGNSYVCGTFTGSLLTIGSAVITNTTAGALVFVVKYDNNGNVLWAKSTGGYPSLYYPSISADASGNSYATGHFLGNYASFGSTILTNTLGSLAYFIVKFDITGNIVWAKGGNSAQGNDIAVDPSGNIYTTGFLYLSTVFNSTALYGNGAQDVFVVKYDPAGNVLWAKSAGGQKNDRPASVAVNGTGNTFVTGTFSSNNSIFGNYTLVNCDTITSPYEIFVAKLGSGSTTPTVTNVGLIDQQNADNSISVFPNPFSDETILRTTHAFKNACLTVYNSAGQRVEELKGMSGNEIKFLKAELPAGLYLLQITGDGETATSRVIISD